MDQNVKKKTKYSIKHMVFATSCFGRSNSATFMTLYAGHNEQPCQPYNGLPRPGVHKMCQTSKKNQLKKIVEVMRLHITKSILEDVFFHQK